MTHLPERIILIGPSGSGKSAVARDLAARLAYRVVDTDERIVDRIKMPISDFFARFGEPAFRAIESEMLADACRQEGVVIATGGGAVLSPDNWALMRPRAAIIGLTAAAETLVERVSLQTQREGVNANRPLLAGDAVARLSALLDARRTLYAMADLTLNTENRQLKEVSELVFGQLGHLSNPGIVPFSSLKTPSGRSDIYVAARVRERLVDLIHRRWPSARRVWIVTDENVASGWSSSIETMMRASDLRAEILVVPPGEASKSISSVERLCGDITRQGVTRNDVVVALGGGVIGDLAGFVASITLRGLPLVQIPTSLLAMVDSSIGGKTGVNTESGKNLVGAFYQPEIVLVDPDFLSTLPREEFRSGMAEVLKHSLIQPSTPLGGDSLATQLSGVSLDPVPESVMEEVLRLNVAIKRSVVQADERESGLRMILNFGHTAGHAVEADGYRYRHGEAVAIGMVIASRIALHLGRVDISYVDRVEQLVDRAGLPGRMIGNTDDVVRRLSSDKKNVDGALNWILPRADEVVERVTGVGLDVVRIALRETGAT